MGCEKHFQSCGLRLELVTEFILKAFGIPAVLLSLHYTVWKGADVCCRLTRW